MGHDGAPILKSWTEQTNLSHALVKTMENMATQIRKKGDRVAPKVAYELLQNAENAGLSDENLEKLTGMSIKELRKRAGLPELE